VLGRNRHYTLPANESSDALPLELKEVLIGTLLGDLHYQKTGVFHNARLLFEQGGVHTEYLAHLYDLFKPYCLTTMKSAPRLDKRTGQKYELRS
jgi:hypothetical protein